MDVARFIQSSEKRIPCTAAREPGYVFQADITRQRNWYGFQHPQEGSGPWIVQVASIPPNRVGLTGRRHPPEIRSIVLERFTIPPLEIGLDNGKRIILRVYGQNVGARVQGPDHFDGLAYGR